MHRGAPGRHGHHQAELARVRRDLRRRGRAGRRPGRRGLCGAPRARGPRGRARGSAPRSGAGHGTRTGASPSRTAHATSASVIRTRRGVVAAPRRPSPPRRGRRLASRGGQPHASVVLACSLGKVCHLVVHGGHLHLDGGPVPLDLLKELEYHDTPKLPVVLVTGQGDEEVAVQRAADRAASGT